MEAFALQELWQRKLRQSRLLVEVEDLTRQLQRALERNDRVSVEMVLSMRQGPLQELQELEAGIQGYLRTLPWEAAVRGSALLNGAEPERQEETQLSQAVARYRRQLAAVIEADKQTSLRVGGKLSFYSMYGA